MPRRYSHDRDLAHQNLIIETRALVLNRVQRITIKQEYAQSYVSYSHEEAKGWSHSLHYCFPAAHWPAPQFSKKVALNWYSSHPFLAHNSFNTEASVLATFASSSAVQI